MHATCSAVAFSMLASVDPNAAVSCLVPFTGKGPGVNSQQTSPALALTDPMRELVYISGNAPRTNSTHVHGLWQRQQLFIEALGPMFDRVHCVFLKGLGPGEFEDDAEVQARFEGSFGRDVQVSVLRAARREARHGYVDYYARSIFLGPAEQGHRRLIGPHRQHSSSTAFRQAHQRFSRTGSR